METDNKLRILREQKGWSQEYVANELGISQSAYFKLETEQTKLTIDRARQLAALYDIEPEFFFSSAKTIHCNNGNGSHSNSGIISRYINNNSPEAIKELHNYLKSKDLQIDELISLLKDELLESRKEREKLTTLVKKLLEKFR